MTIYYSVPGFGVSRVTHGFFGRTGGVSTGVYQSLNAGYGVDDRETVGLNRDIIARTMGGAGRGDISTMLQVHSNRCRYIDAPVPLDQRSEVDAMVTDKLNVILGVITADCGPVLLWAVNKYGGPIIGAVHAGWRGALSGVLDNTVQCMLDHGAQGESIVAAVGPCIAQKSYEVSGDFLDPFLQFDPDDERFFKEIAPLPYQNVPQPSPLPVDAGRGDQTGLSSACPSLTKHLFDLPGYIARRLAACGVRKIILSDIDTYTHPDAYFSYRRATHDKSGENGRQMSCIKILT